MSNDESPSETVILLDDADLFQTVADWFRSTESHPQQGIHATPLPPAGAGFATSRRFRINGADFNFLLISPENAHPFAYLTVGQLTIKHRVSGIIAVTQAQTLRRDLSPGDIAIVSEAVALPYPALFQNKDPQNSIEPRIERYQANPAVVENFLNHALRNTLAHIWQKNIIAVRAGYTRHPTFVGGLEPWAPEQFETVKETGIDTLAQTPAGVYEAQHLCPDSEIICFNMIKGAADQPEKSEWNRHKKKLLYPALRLLVGIISQSEEPVSN